MSITHGAIAKILSLGGSLPEDSSFFPIVEVVEFKKVSDGKSGRSAFTIFDGCERMKAVISTQNSVKMQIDQLTSNALVRILACMINDMPIVPGQPLGKMMIILDGEYIGSANAPSSNANRTVDSPNFNIHSNNNMYGRDSQVNSPPSYGINSINSSVNTPINQYGQAYNNSLPPQQTYPGANQGNAYQSSVNQGNMYPTSGNHSNAYQSSANQSNAYQPSANQSNSYQSYNNPTNVNNYSAPSVYGSGASGSSNSNAGGAYSGYANNRPVVREGGEAGVVPISALNPYSTKWTIKARLTSKSDVRKFTNAKGEGCLFSIDLLDATGGEIRGTFFGALCCEKFYNLLAVNQVYFFSGGRLKIANKKFCQLNSEYEITFDERSDIREAAEDTSISKMTYDFTKLADLATRSKDESVDVIGVVKSFSDVTALNSAKLGREIFKREVFLVDDSNTECRVTLWGEKAQQDMGWDGHPVVAFKRAAVDDFNGRALKTLSSTVFQLNPDVPEARKLVQWVLAEGRGDVSSIQTNSLTGAGAGGFSRDTSLFARKTMDYVREGGIGHSERGDYFTVKAAVQYINPKSDPWYTACKKCNKKVVQTVSGFVCEKCVAEYDRPNYRYILNTTLSDETSSYYFTLFDEQAALVLGHSAEQLQALKSTDEAAYDDVLRKALFKQLIVTARAKYETVKDEQRLKCSVNSANIVDFAAESGQLLDAIRKYESF